MLKITNSEKWHYTSLESLRSTDGFNHLIRCLSRLFRGIAGNNHGDYYCLNCLHSFQTDNVFKINERICENHDYCHEEIATKANTVESP